MSQVCIFPLPAIALFPHAILPLHIFEPRYREMIRDCMAGDKRMAVATLAPDQAADDQGRPSVLEVCGLGEVVAFDLMENGRSNILLRGLQRVRIVQELPPRHSYREVRYQALTDHYADAFDDSRAVTELVLLADQIALKLPSGADTLRQLARSKQDAGALSDVLAAALVTEPGERQSLLETVDVKLRVDRVGAEMASILMRFTETRGPAN